MIPREGGATGDGGGGGQYGEDWATGQVKFAHEEPTSIEVPQADEFAALKVAGVENAERLHSRICIS